MFIMKPNSKGNLWLIIQTPLFLLSCIQTMYLCNLELRLTVRDRMGGEQMEDGNGSKISLVILMGCRPPETMTYVKRITLYSIFI